MIVLLGNWGGAAFRQIVAERANIGQLIGPAGWRRPQSPHWACDNDVYSHRDDPGWWYRDGETAWLKMLDKAAVAAERSRPLFVLLPDVVADWPRTVERACLYRNELWQRNLPVGLALQDGCDYQQALGLSPQAVFVGGSTAWKWRHAEEITTFFHWHDVRVHIGRASGPNRIRECLRIGADSCDGTGWIRHIEAMLPGLWRELDGTDPQRRLAL